MKGNQTWLGKRWERTNPGHCCGENRAVSTGKKKKQVHLIFNWNGSCGAAVKFNNLYVWGMHPSWIHSCILLREKKKTHLTCQTKKARKMQRCGKDHENDGGKQDKRECREAGVGIEDRRWEKQQRSFNISSEMIYLSTLWQLQPSGLNKPTTASIMEAEHLRCSVSAIWNKLNPPKNWFAFVWGLDYFVLIV